MISGGLLRPVPPTPFGERSGEAVFICGDEMITQARLKEVLRYDKESGVFYWNKKTSGRIVFGAVAGHLSEKGYIRIQVDGVLLMAHRLAWVYEYGKFPSTGIDHINGIRNDNRISNLREANQSQNCQNLRSARSNNKTGFLGVTYSGRSKKYKAVIGIDGVNKHLGNFSTAEEASQAYIDAKKKLHPFGVFNDETNELSIFKVRVSKARMAFNESQSNSRRI